MTAVCTEHRTGINLRAARRTKRTRDSDCCASITGGHALAARGTKAGRFIHLTAARRTKRHSLLQEFLPRVPLAVSFTPAENAPLLPCRDLLHQLRVIGL